MALTPPPLGLSAFFLFFVLQCGHGNTDNVMAPTHVAPLRGVPMKQAAAGIWHTLALSRDGDLYSWGGNQFGQLGIGSTCAQVRTYETVQCYLL